MGPGKVGILLDRVKWGKNGGEGQRPLMPCVTFSSNLFSQREPAANIGKVSELEMSYHAL